MHATVRLPGSKSITNRALVLAALSDGPSVVRQALRSRDTLLMAAALAQLGVGVDTTGDDWKVTPGRLHGRETLDCGLAGTVMRFVPPVAALADGPVVFDGDPHARLRPMGEILQGLRDLGVTVEDEDRGALPFTVVGTGRVRGGEVTIDASASSQFISALLLAGAAVRRGRRRPPRRQAGPLAPPHRHDRRAAAAARRRRRRLRAEPLAGPARPRSARSTCSWSRTCPTRRRSSPRAWSPAAA